MLLSTIVGEVTRMNEKISLNIIIKNPLKLLGRWVRIWYSDDS